MVPVGRLAVILAALCGAAVCAGAGDARQSAVDARLTSVALGGRMHALVILPSGYATSHRRFPVVYFLHGLPVGSNAYKANAWLTALAAEAGSFILVEPQGARDDDRDAEYLDWGPGRDWSTFVTRELTRYVDAHFRTIKARSGRAIVGASAGGYGAAMLGLNNLDEFSVIESWSGYFHATDPKGRSSIAAPASANVLTLVPRLRRAGPTFIGFYVGRSDPIFVPENRRFDRELTGAGVTHTFAVYPGGHTAGLWADHAVAWLRLATAHLAKPS